MGVFLLEVYEGRGPDFDPKMVFERVRVVRSGVRLTVAGILSASSLFRTIEGSCSVD